MRLHETAAHMAFTALCSPAITGCNRMHSSLSCSQVTKLSKTKCSVPQLASVVIIVETKEILFHSLLNALMVLEGMS